MIWRSILFATCASFAGTVTLAGTLIVRAPAPVASAVVVAAGTEELSGTAGGNATTFANVPENVPVTVQVKLTDGTTLQGIELNWHSDEPPRPDAGPMTDDDREQIRAIVQDVPSFYNKSEVLLLAGDHDRAVALVQLVRDTDFHAGTGQVVWRVELYSFKFQYGGWEKVQQQNRIVRRERFKSIDEYTAATAKLKWVPELGGVVVGKDETRTIEVEK